MSHKNNELTMFKTRSCGGHTRTFPSSIDLGQRAHIRSLYFAFSRGEHPPEHVRQQIIHQFDSGLATAKSRGGRSLTHFIDLAKLLVRLGMIEQTRLPTVQAQPNHRDLADQKYRDALAQQNSTANNRTTSTPAPSPERT